MLPEKYSGDRDDLPKAHETLRDAVWNRLGGGGVALPGAVTSIAALVMSEKVKDPKLRVEYFSFCFRFDSISCSAGMLLFFGALALNLLWLGAVLYPYLDGPKHVTMPRRTYLVIALSAISAYVWFVVWLLLKD